MTTDIFVYPYPLHTIAASKHPSPIDGLPEGTQEAQVEWQKHEGDYLYLHPFWYAFDAQSRLQLVGKGTIKLTSSYGGSAVPEEMRLDLETLLHMPIDEQVTMGPVELNSMIVLALRDDEPEHMFHPGSYVLFAQWFYQVERSGVLRGIGRVESGYINEGVRQGLALTGLQFNVHMASEAEWDDPRAEKPETEDQLVERLMQGLTKVLNERKRQPKIGDHIEVTSGDGYKVLADCVPDPGVLQYDPRKGKPFVLAISSILCPDGTPLKEHNELLN